MILTPEQVAAAQKANLETLFGLTTKAFEGVEKLVELNLQVVKTSFAEGVDNAKKALSAKDAQELLAIQAAAVQPVAEKTLAYTRHLYEIASETQSEFTKVAEAQLAEGSKNVQALVENLAKNAPAGSESTVAIVKSAISAANNAYESVQKATKQAVEIAETNFQAGGYGCHQGCPASQRHGPYGHGKEDDGCLITACVEDGPAAAGPLAKLIDAWRLRCVLPTMKVVP
nr:GA24 protein [Cupriavidus necator]